jgi:hypothetical protein
LRGVTTRNSRTAARPLTELPVTAFAELYLYLDYLKEQLEADTQSGQFAKKKKYYATFCKNLGDGIQFYRQLATVFDTAGDPFLHALDDAELELDGLNYQYEISEPVKVGTEALQMA